MVRTWGCAATGFLLLAVACSGDVEEQVQSEGKQKAEADPPAIEQPEAGAKNRISWTGCDISKKKQRRWSVRVAGLVSRISLVDFLERLKQASEHRLLLVPKILLYGFHNHR